MAKNIFVIGTIIKALQQITSKYWDAKKEEKEKIKKSFLKIKKVLDSSLIKIGLSEISDELYDSCKLEKYIPDIALELNSIARETAESFPTDIYNGLNALSKEFVKFNKYASIMKICNLQNKNQVIPIPDNASFQNNLTLKQLTGYLEELRSTVEQIEK